MSWFGSEWKYRRAVIIDNSAGAGGTADVAIPMPIDDGEFVDHVLAAYADLRVTEADGITRLGHAVTVTGAVATIQVNNAPVVAGAMSAVWLYWGNPDATIDETTFTPSSPLDGHVFLGVPSERRSVARSVTPGSVKPSDTFAKGTDEETYLFVDFSPLLIRRSVPYEGYSLYEEIEAITVVEVREGGTGEVAGTGDITLARLLDGGVAHWIKGGTSGDTYHTVTSVTTTLGRTLEHRTLLVVRDVTE